MGPSTDRAKASTSRRSPASSTSSGLCLDDPETTFNLKLALRVQGIIDCSVSIPETARTG
jgi:hypothetical protein